MVPGIVPFVLPFQTFGDDLMLAWDYAHEYTNPVTPEGWPKASTGPRISPSGTFHVLYVTRSQVVDRERTVRALSGRIFPGVAVVAVDAHGWEPVPG